MAVTRPRARLRFAAMLAAAITAAGCATTTSAPQSAAPGRRATAAGTADALATSRSYALVVDQVLPSAVLVCTPAGLGSGVVSMTGAIS